MEPQGIWIDPNPFVAPVQVYISTCVCTPIFRNYKPVVLQLSQRIHGSEIHNQFHVHSSTRWRSLFRKTLAKHKGRSRDGDIEHSNRRTFWMKIIIKRSQKIIWIKFGFINHPSPPSELWGGNSTLNDNISSPLDRFYSNVSCWSWVQVTP